MEVSELERLKGQQKNSVFVTLTKAGVQTNQQIIDTGLRRYDRLSVTLAKVRIQKRPQHPPRQSYW